LIRDLTGGFPSGPATIKTPLEQGEQMKATDQNTHRQKPLQWGIRI